MTSQQSPHKAGRSASAHRLVTPTARIIAAMVILITGSGIATIFWKMPTGTELHALYDVDLMDQNLAATPLPHESIAVLSLEERSKIALPALEMIPVADNGEHKYAQVYPAPPAIASLRVEQGQFVSAPIIEPEIPASYIIPSTGISPIRQIIEEKPLLVEPVDREFPPKPDSSITSFRTAEKSGDVLSRLLTDSPLMSALQPLAPFELGNLTPLDPALDDEL